MKRSDTGLSPEAIADYRRSFHRRAHARFQAGEKERHQARQTVLEAVIATAPRFPSVKRVYLFGSITRPGAFRSDSDIDLGVEGADMAVCFRLWRELEQVVTDWMLDVRALEDDDPFSRRVRLKGEVVYEGTPTGS